jgi:hypothetical protein
MVALGAALAWLTAGRSPAIGSALAALLSIAGGIAFLAFSLMLPSLSWNPWRRRRPSRIARVRELCQTSGKSRQGRLAGASLCPQANRISQRGRQLLRRCGHGKPHALSACVWSQNPGPAMDPARLRPLSFSRIGLPHSNDLYHLGCVRSCRSSGDGTRPEAQRLRLFDSIGAGAVAFGVAVVGAVARAGRIAGAISVAATIPVAFGLAFGLGGASSSTVAWAVGAAAAVSIGTLLLAAFAINRQAQANFCCFLYPQ